MVQCASCLAWVCGCDCGCCCGGQGMLPKTTCGGLCAGRDVPAWCMATWWSTRGPLSLGEDRGMAGTRCCWEGSAHGGRCMMWTACCIVRRFHVHPPPQGELEWATRAMAGCAQAPHLRVALIRLPSPVAQMRLGVHQQLCSRRCHGCCGAGSPPAATGLKAGTCIQGLSCTNTEARCGQQHSPWVHVPAAVSVCST